MRKAKEEVTDYSEFQASLPLCSEQTVPLEKCPMENPKASDQENSHNQDWPDSTEMTELMCVDF